MDESFASAQDKHTVYLRPPMWLPIAVAVIVGGMYIAGKYVETRDATPTVISVNGEGKVFAAPDIAELSFGVQTGPMRTSKEAVAKLKINMDAVIAAVKKEGIEEKDIRNQQLSLNPMYDWNDGNQTLRGYEAIQTLIVKVRDLDKVGDVLSAATNAGANQVGGVNFTIDDPEALRAEARQKAIDQAEAKAEELADALGMSLGKLKGFSEGGGYAPPMPYMARGMVAADAMMAKEESLQVPEGEQEINVNVALTYELR